MNKQSYLKPPFFCKLYALLLLTGGIHLETHAQHYWQQQVNYTIDVTLNDVEHTLDAFEKLEYINNSPDTLRFIWFHLWPNAYKNDKTAFSEQLLLNNRTDFYFSGPQQRGYINRLSFTVNGSIARTEDHPLYIDIVKLILPQPLPPKQSILIAMPFHVQLPDNFSRGGHTRQSYQVTQWYPKPAVYDKHGWHEMPYLDQGEFYSEFGNYTVTITLPDNYVVAATGDLQTKQELDWIKRRVDFQPEVIATPPFANHRTKKSPAQLKRPATNIDQVISSVTKKSIQYRQENVHDFAWFADKRFAVNYDTLQLASGKTIQVFSYYLPGDVQYWKNSTRFIKDAVLTRSAWLGEYPYNTVSALEAQMGVSGGMEYPTITCISPIKSEKDLDITIAHEVSHNWLYGILATNERRFPWMDEGMNTYYDGRYKELKYPEKGTERMDAFVAKHIPAHPEALVFQTFAGVKKDQPINTPSEDFTKENYGLSAYYKAGEWMKRLEKTTGQIVFDSCMREYFHRWQFKHPDPDDFKAVFEQVSGKNLDALFNALNKTGSLDSPHEHHVTRLTPLFNLNQTDHVNYISLAPAAGLNLYDGFMIGGLVHNYQLPIKPFDFLLAPLFATKSKKLSGLARASYSWYPDGSLYKISVGAAASIFSINEFQPDIQSELFMRVHKLAPYVRVTLRENALSKMERYVQFKSYFIREDQLQFKEVINGPDTIETVNTVAKNYMINQLKFVINNFRVLYPYSGELQIEQHQDFVRAGFTGKYFLNYANRQGGMNLRFFAGKFFYLGPKTILKEFDTDRFHLNLTGADGQEDYTYSNYFIGRNKFEGFANQQIMIRDGGFKVRTDLLSSKVGKTDNWLMAFNLAADVPKNINPLQVLPFHIPLKLFADVGTYAESWDRDANTSRFLFDAGFQFSFLKDAVNIYVPVVYSRVYKDYFKSTLGNKRFWKIISFSIDVQNLSLRKIDPGSPF